MGFSSARPGLRPAHLASSPSELSGVFSHLALRGENVLPSPAVNSLFIPWDFVLILLFLGAIVPWRGAARIKRLLSKPELTTADRLSLYGSTILFQWLIVAIVGWRALAREVSPEELGIAVGDPWQIAWSSFALTGLLCVTQVVGLRKMTRMPEGKRGSLFAITEKIMPRSTKETWVFAALACTAGMSEEFLYRGFVFMAFVRMIVNYGPPNTFAAILSSVWFSVAHLYQGRRGVITTFVVGMIFAFLRIWTGSLIPVIIAHFGMDLVAGICISRFLRDS
jgi:membrane protease YdiL (CAAX protease family)